MSYIDKNTIIVVSSFKNLVNSIVCDLRHFPFACIKKNQRKDNHANATAYNEKNKQYINSVCKNLLQTKQNVCV